MAHSKEREPAPFDDPRETGWPCLGSHRPGGLKQNQFGRWQTCVRCGLRVFHEVKKQGHGKDRTGGATVDIVALAMDDLQQTMDPDQVTEKIVQGKIMELQGKTASDGA